MIVVFLSKVKILIIKYYNRIITFYLLLSLVDMINATMSPDIIYIFIIIITSLCWNNTCKTLIMTMKLIWTRHARYGWVGGGGGHGLHP